MGDLFGKSTRGSRLKSADRIDGSLPFVTAGEKDEGISAYIGNDVTIFSENTITIDMFGSAKYRIYKYGGDDHVAVVHTEYLPKLATIFVTSAIHKSSHAGQFDYSRNFYAKDADALSISLPTKNGDIDYDFMESFIAELEVERIAELEAYLSTTGLKDYHLTGEEQQALAALDSVEWGEFRLGDLFEIGTGSLLSSRELTAGETPRISAKANNNGITGFFDTKNEAKARIFKNFISVNFFGTDGGIFYHPYEASVEMKVHTLKIPSKEFNPRTGMFIASVLKLSLNGFGYGNQLSSSKLKTLNFKLSLPTKNGDIDYDFMESFISAIQKLVIKDVVAYADKKIAAHHDVVAASNR